METAVIEMEEEMENTLEDVYQSCGDLPSCLNSGQCMENPVTHLLRCQCPLGTLGKQCQIDSVNVKYPQFWGTGYVAFPKLLTSYETFRITVEFRPTKLDGLLLFSSERPTAKGDFFSVALISGKAQFRFNCGTGPAIITSNYNISLNEWHQLTIYRSQINGWVQVNDEQPVHGSSQGMYSRITLRESLYLGGYKNLSAISEYTSVSRGFAGCIKSLKVNRYLYDMRKRREIFNKFGHVIAHHGDILDGMDVALVKESQAEWILTIIALVKESLAEWILTIIALVKESLAEWVLTIIALVKESLAEWILTIIALVKESQAEWILTTITLVEESLAEWKFTHTSSYNLGSGEGIILSNETVIDGQWHNVHLHREGNIGTMVVDGYTVTGTSPGKLKQLNTNNGLYIGGMHDIVELSLHRYTTGFIGCLRSVTLATDYHFDIIADAVDGRNINLCT
ncbi:pikachurin-like [Saccoglossus kowalevskii]